MTAADPHSAADPAVIEAWRRWETAFDAFAVLTLVAQCWRSPAALADAAGVSMLLCGLVAVALRRRWPIAATVAGTAVSAAAGVLAPDTALAVWILAQVCLLSVPLRRSRTATLTSAVALAAVLFADATLRMHVAALDPTSLALIGWTAAVAGAGLTLRAQHEYLDAVRQQTRAAVAARDSEVARRVSDERLRIARDLHDAVAHNIAVISLHAGAADQALTDRPDHARESLRQVRSASRTVLREMQSILTVLRSSADAGDSQPLVSAAAIPDLITQFRNVGVEVATDGDLDLRGLEPAADVAAYRLLQEALTNAQRHGCGTIQVSAARDSGHLCLAVTNRTAARPSSSGSGFGLVGMRERVTSAGGTLHARHQGDHFVVTVSLPLRDDEEERP